MGQVRNDHQRVTGGGEGGQPESQTPPASAAQPRTLTEYWTQVRQWHRYNATLHIGEGLSSFFGLTCFAPQTVLALYVGLLTTS